jgi:hypothetical protein
MRRKLAASALMYVVGSFRDGLGRRRCLPAGRRRRRVVVGGGGVAVGDGYRDGVTRTSRS